VSSEGEPAAGGNHVSRVAMIDPHPIVRLGLRQVVDQTPDLTWVGEAAGDEGIVQHLSRWRADLLVLELALSAGNGLELIKQVRASHPAVKTLVLSGRDERLYAGRVLHAGGSGYIHKREPTDQILQAIRKVMEGGIALSTTTAEWMVRRAVQGEPAEPNRHAASLSDRELEVLELLGQGLGTAQIAQRLSLSPKTVDTYREHLKSKLELKNSAELIRYAVWWSLQQT
jgi:DNA-binding NarL/FixJ family response regulator